MDTMNSFALSRSFWDFAFENTGKIKPIHISIYFFAIEHCNRLGWKRNFGLPTSMVLEAITVKSYSVYKAAFDDLVEFGFFEVIQYSKNQYSSNIIALKENSKADTKAKSKALDKAFIKHQSKQPKSNDKSTVSIDKPVTSNNKQYNQVEDKKDKTQVQSPEQFGTPKTIRVSIKSKYLNESPKIIFDLREYFASTHQLESFVESGFDQFQEFIDANPGRVFNDDGHLYNTFKAFCKTDIESKPKRSATSLSQAQTDYFA